MGLVDLVGMGLEDMGLGRSTGLNSNLEDMGLGRSTGLNSNLEDMGLGRSTGLADNLVQQIRNLAKFAGRRRWYLDQLVAEPYRFCLLLHAPTKSYR
jgi:hypothetical protein